MKLCKGSSNERHIFAASNYQKHCLKLVPYSPHLVSILKEGRWTAGPSIQVQLGLKESVGDTLTATFRAADVPMDVTSHPPFAKELIVPFWLVRSTADENLANMGRSTLTCTCSITAGGKESKGDAVRIPILHNLIPIQEGDELLVYDRLKVTPKPVDLSRWLDQPRPTQVMKSQ